jgi:hypothetical protein
MGHLARDGRIILGAWRYCRSRIDGWVAAACRFIDVVGRQKPSVLFFRLPPPPVYRSGLKGFGVNAWASFC